MSLEFLKTVLVQHGFKSKSDCQILFFLPNTIAIFVSETTGNNKYQGSGLVQLWGIKLITVVVHLIVDSTTNIHYQSCNLLILKVLFLHNAFLSAFFYCDCCGF